MWSSLRADYSAVGFDKVPFRVLVVLCCVLLQPEMERRPTRVILQLGRSLTMRKPRKNYTPVEKVSILRRHLIDRVPISDLCDEHQLSPTLFSLWQKQFFENGPAAFERKNAAPEGHLQRTIAALRDKLQ